MVIGKVLAQCWSDYQAGIEWHLWQVLLHLLGKEGAIVALAHIVQLLKEASSPLV